MASSWSSFCDRSGAMDFITANQSQPFFAYLSTNAPHTPLDVSEDYYDTLEFDIAYTSIDALTINIHYNDLSDDPFIINNENFEELSNNGKQPYRWHHISL